MYYIWYGVTGQVYYFVLHVAVLFKFKMLKLVIFMNKTIQFNDIMYLKKPQDVTTKVTGIEKKIR
jgi:hypothetical protein